MWQKQETDNICYLKTKPAQTTDWQWRGQRSHHRQWWRSQDVFDSLGRDSECSLDKDYFPKMLLSKEKHYNRYLKSWSTQITGWLYHRQQTHVIYWPPGCERQWRPGSRCSAVWSSLSSPPYAHTDHAHTHREINCKGKHVLLKL